MFNFTKNRAAQIIIIILLFICCSGSMYPSKENTLRIEDCGCNLSLKAMRNKLPITAIGNKIKVCKLGTIYAAGSKKGSMTWTEYLESKFYGGEGQVYNCVENKNFIPKFKSYKLKLSNDSLFIFYRIPMEVYDSNNQKWLDLELETYEQSIYAKKDSLFYSEIQFTLKPPYQSSSAFKSALDNYDLVKTKNRHNDYLVFQALKRLFTAAINGDSTSRKKFLMFPDELYDKFLIHKKNYNFYLRLLNNYDNYLKDGGKVEYYNLKEFLYFHKLEENNKN